MGRANTAFESDRLKRMVKITQSKDPAIWVQVQVEHQISRGSRTRNPGFAKRQRKCGKESKTVWFPFYPRPDHT